MLSEKKCKMGTEPSLGWVVIIKFHEKADI